MEQWLNRYTEVRQELIDLIKRFPENRVEEVLFGAWSLRQILAHLIGWDVYFTDLLKLLAAGQEPPYWGSIQEFNQLAIAQREDRTWQEVYDEFIQAGEAFIDTYSDVEDDVKDLRFWENRSYTPVKILKVNLHHYEKSHLPEIKKIESSL
jgi:uncharacterized damage-inducible protein DinB